eukprot:GEMP01013710.1.p1 GENE.GEMP01013710.1~~GEMP01013710.1.p1  ORF type:complete len:838 (+),score=185.74 GEMP01013710.1:175-2688(+)
MDSLNTDATRIANIVDSVVQHRLAVVHDQIRNLEQTVAVRRQEVSDILQYVKMISTKLGVAIPDDPKPAASSYCMESDGAVSSNVAINCALAAASGPTVSTDHAVAGSKGSEVAPAVLSASQPRAPTGEHPRTWVKPTLEEIAAQIAATLPDERRHINARNPPIFLLHPHGSRGKGGKGGKPPSLRSTHNASTPIVTNPVTQPVTAPSRKRAVIDGSNGVPSTQKRAVQSPAKSKAPALCSPSSSSSSVPGHTNKRARTASVHSSAVDSSAHRTIGFSVHDNNALIADLDPNDPMLCGVDLTALSLAAFTPAIPTSPPRSSGSAIGLTTAPPASSGSRTALTTAPPASSGNELPKSSMPDAIGASTDDSESESIDQAMSSLLKTAENVLQARGDTSSEDEGTMDDARVTDNLSFPMAAGQSSAASSCPRAATEASQSGFPTLATSATSSFPSVTTATKNNFPTAATPSDFPAAGTETRVCFPTTVTATATAAATATSSFPAPATEAPSSLPTKSAAVSKGNFATAVTATRASNSPTAATPAAIKDCPTAAPSVAANDGPTAATAVAASGFPTTTTAVAASGFPTTTRLTAMTASATPASFTEKESSSSSSIPSTAIQSIPKCNTQLQRQQQHQPQEQQQQQRDVSTLNAMVQQQAWTGVMDEEKLWEVTESEAPADACAAETGAPSSASAAPREVQKTSGEPEKAAEEPWNGPWVSPSITADSGQERVPAVKNGRATKGKSSKSGKSGKSGKGGGKAQRGKWRKGAEVDTTTTPSTTKTASSWLNNMYDKPTTKQSVTLPQSADSNPLRFTPMSSAPSTQANLNSFFGNIGCGEMIF